LPCQSALLQVVLYLWGNVYQNDWKYSDSFSESQVYEDNCYIILP
jgi:hypothetical protein